MKSQVDPLRDAPRLAPAQDSRALTSVDPEKSTQLRVLLHDYGGYSFVAQLARELAKRGHLVHFVHSATIAKGPHAVVRRPDDSRRLTIERISVGQGHDRYKIVGRFRLERAYARRVIESIDEFQPDIVLTANTPLLVQHWVQGHLGRKRIPVVNWLQDVHSVAIADDLVRRFGPPGHVAATALNRMEGAILRSSAAVVVITPDFVPLVRRCKVDAGHIHVKLNWAELIQAADRKNRFSGEHGLDDKITLLYAGTLGLKHDIERLLVLAEEFRGRPEVAIVVVSEGLGRRRLEEEREARRLGNLLLLDYQPEERLADMLGSADVLLSMIRPAAAKFSVPSKVLSYLVAGRCQLSAIPLTNTAARILLDSGGGLVVEPDDAEEWLCRARELITSVEYRDELGRKGRAYAEANFHIDATASWFEGLLMKCSQTA
jgi:glycosyltransferase involved in cell wall biosynthesis